MVVGLPVSPWVANDGPEATGPITRSATAGSTTVTATARVTEMTWDMGDGATVDARALGRVDGRTRHRGVADMRAYTYEQPSIDEPDRPLDVTATTHWQVDWRGGQTGEITLSGERELEVTEIQVLQTR